MPRKRRPTASSRQRIAASIGVLAVAFLLASFEADFPRPLTFGALLTVAVLMWVEFPIADIGRDVVNDLRTRGWSWPLALVGAAVAVASLFFVIKTLWSLW